MNVAPTRRARRALAVIARLAVSALALSGCLYALIPEERPVSTSSPAPDTEGVDEDLLPFYEQTVEWEDCGAGFKCSTITAPLDWADPAAGEIDLALVRNRATGGEPVGSLLTNPGGPGSSGVDLVRESLTYAVGEALIEEYDVMA